MSLKAKVSKLESCNAKSEPAKQHSSLVLPATSMMAA